MQVVFVVAVVMKLLVVVGLFSVQLLRKCYGNDAITFT